MTATLTPLKVTESVNPPKISGRFHSAMVIASLLFVAINALVLFTLPAPDKKLTKESVVNSIYESRQRGPWSWWIARAFFINQPADIILMGDSQMNAAIFQADAMARRQALDTVVDHEVISMEKRLKANGHELRVLNLSTPGSFASDQFLMSKALFPSHPPKVVIVGVSPRFLIDCTLPSASSTETFKFFASYVDLRDVANITFAGFFDRLNWLIDNHLPLWRVRDQADELIKSLTAVYFGKPSQKSSYHQEQDASTALQAIISGGDLSRGEAIIPAYKSYGYKDNTKEYLHRYHTLSSEQLSAQLNFFDKYLSSLHRMGVRVIVVGMPSLPAHRKLLHPKFWSSFKQAIGQICRVNGAEWHDITNDTRFVQAQYLDNVHLNQDGGALFIDILMDWLKPLPIGHAPQSAD